MNLLQSVLATVIFELRRSWTPQRMMVALVLGGFPPAMVTVISLSGNEIPITDLLILTLALIVGLLAQLLWATPNIYSELEGRSWIFLASRPRGRTALFLGKYVSSVLFSLLVCGTAISLCLAVRTYMPPTSMINPFPTWIGMMASALTACLTYSAVFSLIGTIFQKRAMVFGAAWAILSEGVIANVPAIISRFTPRYHLQAVASDWIGWFLPIKPDEYHYAYGEFSTLIHITSLAAGAAVLLMAGSIIVTSRQYITAEEV